MEETLKRTAIVGVGWSAIERFSTQGVQFLIQIILARLLLPSDYGIVGIMVVFLQISQVFVDSGFANALIKKKDCSDKDYSTVFWYNISISLLIYCVLYVFSSSISVFYDIPLLKDVIRFLALSVILNSIIIVQKTILVKKIDFRTQSVITLSSVLISGVISISLAYKGWGVWALCWQTIINNIVQIVLYFVFVKWRPHFVFNKQSFKELFKFGGNLLVSSLINTIYRNMYPLVIGKSFTTKDLGCFSRAEQFAIFPSFNIGSIIIRVVYPVLSKIQGDDNMLIQTYRKVIRLSSYIIFPLMLVLCALAEPIVVTTLTEKWIDAVPLLQILCLDWMLDHISGLNLNLLYVKNRTDLVLRLEIVKKIIALTILFSTLPFGLIAVCWGRVLYSIVATYINCYYTEKLFSLKFLEQMRDLLNPMITGIVLFAVIFIMNINIDNMYLKLACGLLISSPIYIYILFKFIKIKMSDLNCIIKK